MSDENNLFSILMTQEPLTAEEKEALEGIEKRLETFGDAAASVDLFFHLSEAFSFRSLCSVYQDSNDAPAGTMQQFLAQVPWKGDSGPIIGKALESSSRM